MSRLWLARVVVLVSLLAGGPPPTTAARAPAEAAEMIRAQLVRAQLAWRDDPARAATLLAEAQATYDDQLAGPLARDAAAPHARVVAGFAAAQQALPAADATGFAAARATIWTALLAGAAAVVEQALRRGEGGTAQDWLGLREFRRTTGTALPGTDATLALADLRAGAIGPDEAGAIVRADLLDAYQSRLDVVLGDLAAQQAADYAPRRAEATALAAGYFLILAPAYGEQRGAAARAAAEQAFTRLAAAGVSGADLPAALAAVQEMLRGFRAAPLTVAQQQTRAGQLLGFLALVPIEYERGVRDGRITVDLEVQEAISFHEGAAAAFNDLHYLLIARDADKAAQVAADLLTLQQQLAAPSGRMVAPSEIRGRVERITALLREIMPPAWLRLETAGFDIISRLLDQIEIAVGRSQYDGAAAARLDAYVTWETSLKGRLLLFAPDHVAPIEDLLQAGDDAQPGLVTLLGARAGAGPLQAMRIQLDQALTAARARLADEPDTAQQILRPAGVVWGAGLLPVLLLVALAVGLRRAAGGREARALGLGALGGLLVTAAWALAPPALLTTGVRYAEPLRAGAALLVSGLLLGVLVWFFRRLQRGAESVAAPPGRSFPVAAGLALLGLLVVLSRGVDLLLLLQPLLHDPDPGATWIGTALGLGGAVLTGGVVAAALARRAFGTLRWLVATLGGAALGVLAGESAHLLGAVGVLPLHALDGVAPPAWLRLWLGIHPTWEGVVAQLAAVLLAAGIYRWAMRGQAHPQLPA